MITEEVVGLGQYDRTLTVLTSFRQKRMTTTRKL